MTRRKDRHHALAGFGKPAEDVEDVRSRWIDCVDVAPAL